VHEIAGVSNGTVHRVHIFADEGCRLAEVPREKLL
jgi:hypothetical protein